METKDAEYWVNKSSEFYKAKKDEEAVECCNKAIKCCVEITLLDPNNASAFYIWGNALSNIAEIKKDIYRLEEASEKYEKSTQLDPNNAAVFYTWGNVLCKLAQIEQDEILFEEACEKYDIVTTLTPKDASAFNNWGLALYCLAEIKNEVSLFENAIEKYEKSILLDPTHVSTFNNCGLAFYKIAKIKKDASLFYCAIEKYKTATTLGSLDTDKAKAFNNWGLALEYLAETTTGKVSLLESAIEKYCTATQLDPNYAIAFYNRELARYKFSEYKRKDAFQKALDSFEMLPKGIKSASTPISIGKMYIILNQIEEASACFIKSKKDILEILTFLYKEDREKIFNTKIFHLLLDSDNNDGTFFKDATAGLSAEDRLENINKYKEIYIRSIFIISLLHVNNPQEMLVAHYCKKEVSQTLLFNDDTKFRLNAINNSNDPTEGKTLLVFLYGKENLPFDENVTTEYGAFATCFTFSCDNLNLFRLYGKENDKEGTGVSLVFRNNFFSKEAKMPRESPSIDSFDVDDDSFIENKKSALFRCIYIDPDNRTKQPVVTVGRKEEYLFYRDEKETNFGEYNKEIDGIIDRVRTEMGKLKELANKLEPVIVSRLLLNLRYLVFCKIQIIQKVCLLY
jgi:tetratricopeptide (TPR) repeat protein